MRTRQLREYNSFVCRFKIVYITIGCWLSCNFSKSPWSKNSSATSLAILCCTSHGFAIALTSQAVIRIPHNTAKKRDILFISSTSSKYARIVYNFAKHSCVFLSIRHKLSIRDGWKSHHAFRLSQ